MGNKPMAYKISEPTYTLPGEGSRENYSEGTFKATDYAVESGNLNPKGFGDLRSSYEGGTPANYTAIIDPNTIATVDKIATDNAPEGGGDVRGALKDEFDNAEDPDFTPTEQTWTKI